jgi:sulfur carrier protein ThiS adenylyltransferase
MNTTPSLSDHPDRDLRQRDLVAPEKLATCRAVVVGVGAIGHQVALQLAAIGLLQVDLFDHDTVEAVNLAPQGYFPADLGQAKVDATAALCLQIHPAIQIMRHPERFTRASPKLLASLERPQRSERLIVFCCVDSIGTRRLVWEALRDRASFFVDGRMSAEVIRVLACGNPSCDVHYASTLFEPQQAYIGSCTAKSTIYTASIAAGLMLSQFTRWLRGLPVDQDLSLNLLTSELSVAN